MMCQLLTSIKKESKIFTKINYLFMSHNLNLCFYENVERKRLCFYDNFKQGLSQSEIIILALPTPSKEDGSSDLQHVLSALKAIAPHLVSHTIIVTKSTVPVKTTEKVQKRLRSTQKSPLMWCQILNFSEKESRYRILCTLSE